MGSDRRRGWRKPLTTALKLAVSCGLLAWVLHKTNLASVAHSLASASPEWLALALALGFAATMVQAKQWQRLLLAVGLDRTITRSLRIVFVGNTFNTVLPSSIGGDAARAVYISERPGERPQGAVAVALQRLLNFPGMVLLIGLGLALTITSPVAGRARPEALAGVVIGLAILGLALSPLLGRVGASTSLSRLPGGKPFSTSLRVLDGFRSQRADLAAAVGRGVMFWTLTVLNQWCFIKAMGIHISPGYAALSVTLVNGLTMLPVSINGFGAREGGYTALLAGTGLATTAQAVSVGLLVGAQSLLYALIGVGCLLTMRSAATWARRVEAAAAAVATLLYVMAGLLSLGRLVSSVPCRGGHHRQRGDITRDDNNPLPAAEPGSPASQEHSAASRTGYATGAGHG
jgi:glycosyltransferase 2 family protein